jgi:hypothetical protein
MKPDYDNFVGFDAAKYTSLIIRALYKPQILNKQQQLIIILCIVILLILLALAFIMFKQYKIITTLPGLIESLRTAAATAGVPNV